MTNSLPTRKDIKESTDFIPLLYDENITLYKTNPKGDIFGGGYYSYHSAVNTFFELASKPCWADYQYLENFSGEMIEPNKIEEASNLVKWGQDQEGKVMEFYAVTNLWPAENAIREADKQGAFLFWNHPSWTAQRSDGIAILDPIHEKLINEKLLHGIEVINGGFYSEEAFQIALDNKLTVMGTSDVHNLIDWDYEPHSGGHRPVTLILSKARNEDSIKSALFSRRTVVWYKDLLIGEERNVDMLVKACLEISSASYMYSSSVLRVRIKNNSDTKFTLKNNSGFTIANDDDYIEVPPQDTVTIEVNTLERLSKIDLDLQVLNAITAPKENLSLTLSKRIE